MAQGVEEVIRHEVVVAMAQEAPLQQGTDVAAIPRVVEEVIRHEDPHGALTEEP